MPNQPRKLTLNGVELGTNTEIIGCSTWVTFQLPQVVDVDPLLASPGDPVTVSVYPFPYADGVGGTALLQGTFEGVSDDKWLTISNPQQTFEPEVTHA